MTAAAAALPDRYRPDFAGFAADRREPDAIARLRRKAFTRFETLGLPTRQQEDWRLTDLSGLQQWNLQPPTIVPVDAGALPTLDLPAHRLAFVNGRYAPGLSQLREMPDQALIASIGQALLTHPELIVPYLDRLPGLEQHPFAALNTAFWEDGALVYLPPGTVVETPIHLIFHATGSDMAVYPRLLLALDEGAQATVIVEYQGAGRYLNAPVTEARLGDDAVLHYHKIQQESPAAFHFGGIRLQQGRNSEAYVHLLSFGGLVARTDLEALLDGEGANCTLNGLTLARDQQFSDVHVRVDHAQPHGSSQQVFKSVLDGKARTVFDGMIHVRPHAQKTDARQVSRNLLLSRQAQANSNPRLEILADDVKCGHGSTTGFLNPDAEFYLRARGISASRARAMLVHAFANDSLNQIRLTPLRERLAHLLAAGLALDFMETE
ncbi:Fe-S cluster assembly protein SufD [Candidatus Contendibacter odensensis]|uniref:SufD, needed for fhuF Fe-S center production/stability n=1 Tax=Candidatus Contendobacter odensis Run_B_J11 TaxID=1400861 RepID=A0A7U7GGI3_9GAMM|nr:Fe-S cluster assembly protein SufD [Candidatus Contendobacter odensis]CDH47751.1 putative SufD, needed for fhuF Fe-S center production/stability [Candidatus Contendobacter odensis Run_B_J11]